MAEVDMEMETGTELIMEVEDTEIRDTATRATVVTRDTAAIQDTEEILMEIMDTTLDTILVVTVVEAAMAPTTETMANMVTFLNDLLILVSVGAFSRQIISIGKSAESFEIVD